MFWPSDVRLVDRAPGVADGISVFVTSSFDGTLAVPKDAAQAEQTLQKNQNYDAASWKALDAKSPLHLEMPTAWSPGFTYDEFRAYGIETTEGKRTAATVAVVAHAAGRLLEHPGDALDGPAGDPEPQQHADDRRARRTCSSTRRTTCTWWPGSATARSSGSSTRSTTSCPTTS